MVVEWPGVPLLVDPPPSLDTVSAATAFIGVGLLVVDAVVPVPSSVMMSADLVAAFEGVHLLQLRT